jgi:hypothetical protein
MSLAQAEVTEHEQDDDNRTDEPDDLIHYEGPFAARDESGPGRPAHVGSGPNDAI